MASRLEDTDNQSAIVMRIGILLLAAVTGLAQTKNWNYRPSQPKTAPDMIQVGGPEWGFAHPNPAFLASFNVKDLLGSPIGVFVLAQVGRSLSLEAGDVQKLKLVLDEIDQVSLSAQPKSAQDSDMLVLLTGHFENQLLVKLLRNSQGPTPRMLDSSTMLLGNGDSVEAAVRRISSSWSARRSDPLIQRARVLTGQYDVWFTGPPPPQLAAAIGGGGGLRSFTFGLSFGKQIRLVLGLDTWTPQAANQLLANYRKIEAAGLAAAATRAQWEMLSRSLRIEKLSPGIQFSMADDASSLPAALLAQMPALPIFPRSSGSNAIHMALAALDTSGAAAARSAPASGKIVILGADGVNELPVK
jgi:hypothetical protein